MSFIPDVPTTEDVLAVVLSSAIPPLPPQEQHLGATLVSWWETDPGEVYVHAEGGTADDRHYASTLVSLQLEPHGFKRAQFDLDAPQPIKGTSYDEGHPLNELAQRHPNVDLFASEDPSRGIKLHMIQVAPELQRQGHASAALQDLLSYADSKQMPLALTPGIPEGRKGLSQTALKAWYRSHGFLPNKGRNKDYAWAESMIRPVQHTSAVRIASWADLMAKAKRLIQSGQVHMLRNGFNNIMGHVIGDHGEYDTEISRDDPNSRAITGWQCSCPWDQYAWQRTRKWKKFEGRPCAHVLALYWKALSTPMDEDLSPEQAEAMGTGQAIHAPAVPEHPPEIEDRIQKGEKPPDTHGLPRSFGPEGDIIQGDQQKLNLPPDAIGHPPGPAQAPLAPPPGQGGPMGPTPPGVLPPFPGEQQQMPWGGPGTTPGGGVSPPGAYSVPGAKPPNQPNNPIQNPATYSKVKSVLREIMDGDCDYGDIWIDDDKKIIYLNIGDAFGDLIEPARAAAQEEYSGYEIEVLDEGARPPNTRIAADFNAPQVVRLKNDAMGVAEGPVKGQYGDGDYREIPAGTPGEVLSQDPSTQWVECIFPLNDSGPHEPFHVKCFLEASDIEPTGQSNAFIRRHTRMAGIAPVTGWEPENPDEWERWHEATRDWRSQNPRVPKDYAIDPEFNCMTNAENLIALDPSLQWREGWTRNSSEDEWGAHAWAVTPEGDIVDPYAEWRNWNTLEYREEDNPWDRPGPPTTDGRAASDSD